jgi:hypothetical protein
MKSLSDSGALLAKAVKDLSTSWEMTSSSWRDQARKGFEDEHLSPLIRQACAAASAMDHIAALLRESMATCR